MKLPQFGVFSPYTMMLYSESTGEPVLNLLKRAFVLFDKLIFIPLGLGSMGDIDELISKDLYLSQVTGASERELKYISDAILIDKDIFENTDDFHRNLYEREEDDLWGGDATEKYISWVEKYIDNKYSQSDDLQEKWELKKFYVANISLDIKMIKIINSRFDICSGLLSEVHEAAAIATYGLKTGNPERIVKTLSDLNMFDFASLSWSDLIKLKNDRFLCDFRSFIADWTLKYSEHQDTSSFEVLLSRFIQDAQFDFIEKKQPNLTKTILSGIGGNIPVPTIVNPISVYSSIESALKEHDLQKKFGWLFFVQRSRKKSIVEP